jgi:hypothetical protein
MKNNFNLNIVFIIFVITLILFIPLFNCCVNPYNVFFRKNVIPKQYDDRNMRDSVYPIMKLEKNNHYDYVWLAVQMQM